MTPEQKAKDERKIMSWTDEVFATAQTMGWRVLLNDFSEYHFEKNGAE